MKNTTHTTLTPVFVVATTSTGSHCTAYRSGQYNNKLNHDMNGPERVWIESIPHTRAIQIPLDVGLHFSTSGEWEDWAWDLA